MAPSLRSPYNGRNFKVGRNFLFRDPVIDRVERIRASEWCPASDRAALSYWTPIDSITSGAGE
jgi:hypothetical protein